MASITKRGKVWQARVRRAGSPLRAKTFDRKAEAEEWARQIETEIDRGELVGKLAAASMTLGDGLQRWLDESLPFLAAASQASERNRVKAIMKRPVAELTLGKITSTHMSAYAVERRKSVGAHSVRLDLASISRVFTAAQDKWGMPHLANPALRPKRLGLKMPKEGRSRRLSSEEETLLLKTAGPKFRRVICFALATAMRRNEIASLTWSKVDLVRRTALVNEIEGDVARTVPLSEAALEALAEAPKRKRDPGTQPCFGMSPGAITQTMRDVCIEAEIKNLTFHDLRHEAISRLFELTDLRDMEIRGITGHKTLQMLARYSHLRSGSLVDRLPSRANENSPGSAANASASTALGCE